MGRAGHHSNHFSVKPHGCPTVQLSSGTTYLEMASDSTGEGIGPTRPLTYQPRAHTATWASDQLAIDRKFQQPPSLGIINLLEQLTGTLLPGLLVYYERAQLGKVPMRERRRAKYRERGGALCKGIISAKLPCVHQPGHSPNPILLDLYGGFIV